MPRDWKLFPFYFCSSESAACATPWLPWVLVVGCQPHFHKGDAALVCHHEWVRGWYPLVRLGTIQRRVRNWEIKGLLLRTLLVFFHGESSGWQPDWCLFIKGWIQNNLSLRNFGGASINRCNKSFLSENPYHTWRKEIEKNLKNKVFAPLCVSLSKWLWVKSLDCIWVSVFGQGFQLRITHHYLGLSWWGHSQVSTLQFSCKRLYGRSPCLESVKCLVDFLWAN